MTVLRWTFIMVMPAGDGVTVSRPRPGPSPPDPAALALTEATSKAGAGAAGWLNAGHTVKIDRVVPKTTRIFYLSLVVRTKWRGGYCRVGAQTVRIWRRDDGNL